VFGIGGSELVIIAVVALLLFGPDKLPQFGRTVGRFMRDFKRYQDVMESTIKAEMYAAESLKPTDPFKTGKNFREKVEAERAAKAKSEETEGGDAEAPAESDAAEQPTDVVAEGTPESVEDAQAPETDDTSTGEGDGSSSDE